MNKNDLIMQDLLKRYPVLVKCTENIRNAYKLLEHVFTEKGKLLVCGNGGSAADSEHIVGELMKSFVLARTVDLDLFKYKNLQYGLPAISLVSQSSLISAVANDNGADLVFAQQVMGYGCRGDVLWCISSSGNSENVLKAAEVAKRLGLFVLGLTGLAGGRLAQISDVCIKVPEKETYKIQELHLPVYHCLCMMIENHFFS
ncbi:MAG: SIS domain-containing protein [Treponema sp.]|jgi:D-sedoheptulose 7-phosphate isomerase|nr:SIS domain-containing protein [Treponema sp.]